MIIFRMIGKESVPLARREPRPPRVGHCDWWVALILESLLLHLNKGGATTTDSVYPTLKRARMGNTYRGVEPSDAQQANLKRCGNNQLTLKAVNT